MNMFNPAHPGAVLLEAYVRPLGMTITELARRLDISRKTGSELVNARGSVTVEMALRLGKATGSTAQSWLNMQVQWDLWRAKKDRLEQSLHVERLAA